MLKKIQAIAGIGLLGNKSLQNFFFLAMIQASNMLISLISMPLLVQSIGVDQFGLVNLALSVIMLANYLVDYGFSISGPRKVAIHQGDAKTLSIIYSEVLFTRLGMALGSSFLIIALIYGFGFFSGYQIILLLSLVLLFSEALLPLWFFQGMENLRWISLGNISGKLLFLLAIILFIHSPEQAKWVNFALGTSGLLINLLLFIYIRKALNIRVRLQSFVKYQKILVENSTLFFSNLTSYLSIKGGIFILSFFASASILGMYSVAERPIAVLRLLPSILIQSVFPRAAKLYQEKSPTFFPYVRKSVILGVLGSLLVSIATFLTAPWIIGALTGNDLPLAIQFLKVMAWIPFLASLNILHVIIFFVKAENRLMMMTSIGMSMFMLLCSLVLLPQWDAIGMAYTLLLTEIFVFLLNTSINFVKNRSLIHGILQPSTSRHHFG